MLIFTPTREVKAWPAKVMLAQDGGESKAFPIQVDLKLMPHDEYVALLAKGDNAALDAILLGFNGIHGEDQKPLADTKANRAMLYQHAPFTRAVFKAYAEANSGEAARKN